MANGVSALSSRKRRIGVIDMVGYAAAAALLVAMYMAIVVAPLEESQRIHQKIFYIHVPLAMLMYLAFFMVLIGSMMYLWKRTHTWDAFANAWVEFGVIATSLVLLTGSIWGRPTWGAFWSWSDARLVTTLVLWLTYVGYMMLRSLGGRGPRISRFAAIIGIFGFINVPLTYVSVFLWTYLHPKPTLVPGGDVPAPFLLPFLVSQIAFTLLAVYLVTQRYRLERDREQISILRQQLDS